MRVQPQAEDDGIEKEESILDENELSINEQDHHKQSDALNTSTYSEQSTDNPLALNKL